MIAMTFQGNSIYTRIGLKPSWFSFPHINFQRQVATCLKLAAFHLLNVEQWSILSSN